MVDFLEKKISLTNFMLWLIALLALLTVDPFVTSPDLGWHIRSGEEILRQHQVPLSAWFTFTVPEFSWIDHEWLQDIGLFLVWNSAGEMGLRICYALLGLSIAALWLHSFFPKQPLTKFTKATFLLILVVLLVATRALRAQFFTFFFFSVILALLTSGHKSSVRKNLILLPLIFFFWANLHGGFPIGFVLIVLFIIGKLVDQQLRKMHALCTLFPALTQESINTFQGVFPLCGIGILSFLVTLLNPYGWRIYQEIFRTVSDPFPAQIVTEWLPTSLTSHTGEAFFFVAALLVYFLISGRIRKSTTPGQLILVGAFFLFGMSATRHALFFIIVTLPILLPEAARLSPYLLRERRSIITSIVILTMLAAAVLFSSRILSDGPRMSVKEQFYPLKAIAELSNLLRQKRVFHSVEWGGMLLLVVPGFKTFIDGRMTQWQIDGVSFLRTYVSIKDAEPGWEEKLDRYQIDLVLIKIREPLVQELRHIPERWETIYEDKRAIAFRKKIVFPQAAVGLQ